MGNTLAQQGPSHKLSVTQVSLKESNGFAIGREGYGTDKTSNNLHSKSWSPFNIYIAHAFVLLAIGVAIARNFLVRLLQLLQLRSQEAVVTLTHLSEYSYNSATSMLI